MASQSLCFKAGIVAVPGHEITIKGVGSSMGMKASIALRVPLAVGNGIYYWTIIIGDIREDVIIGLDFLHEVGVCLDFNRGFLQIGDSIVIAEYTSDVSGHRHMIAPVTVNERRAILPAHCQVLECDVPELKEGPTTHPVAETIIVEPVPTSFPVLFPPCVLEYTPHISMVVANIAGIATSVPVGTVIGTARLVEDVLIDTEDCSEENSDVVGIECDTPGGLHISTTRLGNGGQHTNSNESSLPDNNENGVDCDTHDSQQYETVVAPDETINEPDTHSSDTSTLPPHLLALYLRSVDNLEGEEARRLQELLATYSDVFAQHDFDLGEFSTIMHRIDTGDAKPVRHGLRRTPLGFQDEEEAHLQKMLDHGIIQPSASEWAAAPVIVKKKDGKYRYCVDYRSLNLRTRKDSFPIPLIEECLDALAETMFFSTLDMASGYWQIVIDPEDRHKTAFITKYGLFEHVRLAMGLCNSPATYQRIMTYVLQHMLWKKALVYLDDIIILGKSFQDHIATLEEILQRFREHNLKFKPKKCELFRTEVDFLGRRVGRSGISIPDAKIQCVRDWPAPLDKTALESFLGFVNYHREFIPGLAGRSAVLYQLAKVTPPGERLGWSAGHQEAFEDLKRAMVSAPVLAYPNAEGTFVLDVDASDTAIGAELSQIQDGQERVIAYSSQSLSAAQRRYCTTRKELLALVTFLNQFRFYLLGRFSVVRTDHNSLIWLMRFKNLEGQLARWLEAISQFDFRIVHRPGKNHRNADGLSRIATDECPYYEAGQDVNTLPCGGCNYCSKMHEQWERFDTFVDDIMPLTMRRSCYLATPEPEKDGLIGRPIDWETEQANDPDIAIVRRWLQEQEEPADGVLFLQSGVVKHLWRHREQLKLQDGLLVYEWVESSGVGRRFLIVTPQQLRREIMEQGHDNVCSGHTGPDRTLQVIRRRFFWPHMATDIRIYVQSCRKCSRNKKGNRTPRSAMHVFHAGEPMERVHVDILGPLTETTDHNKYVLVMIDQFTKWVEMFALPEQTAETVAKTFIEQFVCRMGCALEVFSDQGKNFESQLFHEACEMLQMAKSRTTPYRPSSNGQVERMNREILAKLRMYIEGKQSTWDQYLPFVGMAMRATVNRSTGFTANMMMLGREIMLPVDLLAPRLSTGAEPAASYVIQLRDTLDEVHRCARKKIGAALQVRKRTYDRHIHTEVYEVGDLVYLLNAAGKKGQSRKLQPVYIGPFLVIKVISSALYVITGPRGRHQVIHHDRLRRCSDRDIPLWARRERRRRFESVDDVSTPIEIPDGDDLNLKALFEPEPEPEPVPEPEPEPEPEPMLDLVDVGDDRSGEQVENNIVPTASRPSQSLAPSRHSGRQRRKPAWLRDYIQQRGHVHHD